MHSPDGAQLGPGSWMLPTEQPRHVVARRKAREHAACCLANYWGAVTEPWVRRLQNLMREFREMLQGPCCLCWFADWVKCSLGVAAGMNRNPLTMSLSSVSWTQLPGIARSKKFEACELSEYFRLCLLHATGAGLALWAAPCLG